MKYLNPVPRGFFLAVVYNNAIIPNITSQQKKGEHGSSD